MPLANRSIETSACPSFGLSVHQSVCSSAFFLAVRGADYRREKQQRRWQQMQCRLQSPSARCHKVKCIGYLARVVVVLMMVRVTFVSFGLSAHQLLRTRSWRQGAVWLVRWLVSSYVATIFFTGLWIGFSCVAIYWSAHIGVCQLSLTTTAIVHQNGDQSLRNSILVPVVRGSGRRL